MSGTESHAIFLSDFDTIREDNSAENIKEIHDITIEDNTALTNVEHEQIEMNDNQNDEYSNYLNNNFYGSIDTPTHIKYSSNISIESTTSPLIANEIENDSLTKSTEENDIQESQTKYTVYEDDETDIRIDQDITKGALINHKWRIKTVNNKVYAESDNWIEMEEKNSTAEAVRNDNLVLSTEIKTHLDGDWLHIYANDFRNNGEGLLGLELDLRWNEEGMPLDESRYLKDKIFNKDDLPLFTNIGEINTTGEIISIRGLSAASLPVAMQGRKLGIDGDSGTTLFAKIPIKDTEKNTNRNLNIEIIKHPVIGGKSLEKDQITIIDDKVPKLLFLNINAMQENVGSNHIELIEDATGAEESLIIEVLNVNDSPEVISQREIIITEKEKEEVSIETKNLFTDEDDDKLIYELHPNHEWLEIDQYSGIIRGIPKNDDVGTHTINVRASDPEGKYVEKSIKITIENVNDSPYIKKQIPNMKTSQDIHLSLSVKDNYFSDIDKRNDPNETLSYSLETKESATKWLEIDSLTGILSGTPKNLDVGEYYYKVEATDKFGDSVDQSFFLEVENVNDSPTTTSILENFIDIQLKDDDNVDESDQKYLFYTGEHKTIDFNQWFEDIDQEVDENEQLKIDIFYNDSNGEQQKVDADSSSEGKWVSIDQESKTLTIRASEQDIGRKFLLINVEDQSQASITKIIPIQIRHKNRSPFIDLPPINEWKIGDSGIKNVRYDGTDIYIDLNQDQEILLNLPKSIFRDNDIGIMEDETLTVRQKKGSILEFDSQSLSFTGSTHNLGFNTDGSEQWDVELEVNDHMNEKANLKIHFSLQRKVDEPTILKNLENREIELYERDKLKLKNIFSVRSDEKNQINTIIRINIDSDEADIILRTDNPLIDIRYKGINAWEIETDSANTESIANDVTFEQLNNLTKQQNLKFNVKALSYISNTNIQSETKEFTYEIKYNPIAEIPEWIETSGNKKYENSTLGSLIKAESKDSNERVLYQLRVVDEKDVIITNWHGETIGRREGDIYILNSEEWNTATIRSKESSNQKIKVSITPISIEPSNGLTAYGEQYEVDWYPSSYIDKQASLFSDEINNIQYAGKTTKINTSWHHDYHMTSGFIQYELNKSSKLYHMGKELIPYKEHNENNIYRIAIENPNENMKIGVDIHNPLINNQKTKLKIQTFFSEKDNYWEVNEIEKTQDIIQKLILQSNEEVLNWDLIKTAEEPEILRENGLYSVNQDTGELMIKTRRGTDLGGDRNKDELITINISNIPQGYLIAKKYNDEYVPCGATDVFGTVTVFVKSPLVSNADIDDYENFGEEKIYLVKRNDKVISNDDIILFVSAASNIPSETRGETRSKNIQAQISILKDSAKNLPILSRNIGIIDPIIVDFTGEGLQLTNLVDENQGVQFEMIPSKSALKTAWLANDGITLIRNKAAFLVYDEFATQRESVHFSATNSSHLFSEYFQSPSGIKKWQSGVEALKSLDSNNDLLINNDDSEWANLKLWFDDGDAKTENDEIVHISDFVESIDLRDIELLTDDPIWASSNRILRSFKAYQNEDIYKLYDVGLANVPNQNQSPIKFAATRNIDIKEGDQIGTINISTEESDRWKKQNKDNLTLVRLSGVPSALSPSIGIQDDLGDWVMTWKSIRDAGNSINLIQDSDWSGDANIQIIISQLQDDGSIRTSNLETFLLKVKPTADPPILITQNQRVNEDEDVKVGDIVQLLQATDRDNSESLGIIIKKTEDLTLKKIGLDGELEEVAFGNMISKDDIANYYLSADSNVHGNFEVKITAYSQDGNDINQSVNSIVNINYSAVADNVLSHIHLTSSLALVEGVARPLKDMINMRTNNEILIDNDGSESLEIEIIVPRNIVIKNPILNTWKPLQTAELESNKRLYVILNEDLDDLSIKYVGQPGHDPPRHQNINANYVTREGSNGQIKRSKNIQSVVSIDYNAKAPTILEEPSTTLNEDSGIDLINALPIIMPGWKEDVLYIKNLLIPEGIYLMKKGENQIYRGMMNEISLSTADRWILRANDNLSGDFILNYSIEARPGYGQGSNYILNGISNEIKVAGIADIPYLSIGKSTVDIKQNGWLPIEEFIELPVKSQDRDGSESVYLELTIIGEAEDPQVRFNKNINQLSNNSWRIFEESINDLQIYFGEISSPAVIKIKAVSQESSTEKSSEEQQVIVRANAQLYTPIIESNEIKNLEEDTLIPILTEDGGNISIITQGNTKNQNLFVDIDNIPEGFVLVKANIKDNLKLSNPININEHGEIVSSIRLPYDSLKGLAIDSPDNFNGKFNIDIQAIMQDNEGNEKISKKHTLEFILLASNDAPIIDNSKLQYDLIEGENFELSLQDLVSDVDNSPTDLTIELYSLNNKDPKYILPNWLTLTETKKLVGTPGNDDVGDFNIGLIVSDALGLENRDVININVGNKNQGPRINNDSDQLTNWKLKTIEGSLIYEKNILYGDELILNLNNRSNGLFIDDDIKYGDALNFEMRLDDQTNWSKSILNFAEIRDNNLYFKAASKNYVGTNKIFLKATDSYGKNIMQRFDLTVINVNSPPTVIVSDAIKVSSDVWKKSLTIKEGDSLIIGNMFQIFDDEDITDNLRIMRPELSSWLELQENGSILAKPVNDNVGNHRLQWQATDNDNARANFILELVVENINNKPEINLPSNITVKQDEDLEINLNNYVTDPDEVHGDTLSYKVKIYTHEGLLLKQPEWLQVLYRTPEPPLATDSLLMTPTIYRLDSQGNEVGKINANQLDQLNNNQKVRIKLNIYDNRPIDKRGIIGADMTIRNNSNLEIQSDSIKINEYLPLFNSIKYTEGELNFTAGSAPDALGIGKPVGIDNNNSLLQFDAVIKDSRSAIVIDIDSNKDVQDALADRYANKLDMSNSLWHSFATRMDARLHFEKPANIDVGNYLISIGATDGNGKVAQESTNLIIENVNDKPFLIQSSVQTLTDFFKSGFLTEGEKKRLESLPLFADPDWIHESLVSDKLKLEVKFQGEYDSNDFFKIHKTGAGSFDLELDALPGYTSSIDSTFKIEATDSEGESVSTEWIKMIFNPIPKQTLIREGAKNSALPEIIDNIMTPKNTTIRLFELLNSNLILPEDIDGDEVFVKMFVGSDSAELSIRETNIIASEISGNGKTFTIDCRKIADLTGDELGNLRSLEVKLKDNEIQSLIPRQTSQKAKYGVPIKLWTETRVKEDLSGKYGTVSSPIYDIQIEFKNNKPIFSPQGSVTIDKKDFNDKVDDDIIINAGSLNDMFYDSDINDSLKYFSSVPKIVSKSISIKVIDDELLISLNKDKLDQIKEGIYNIVVEAHDSSGQAGDINSGTKRGIVKLIIKDSQTMNKRLSGLIKLQNMDPESVLDIISSSSLALDDDELEIKNIIKELRMTPTGNTPLSEKQRKDISSLVTSLAAGESKILASKSNEKSLLLLQTRSGSLMEDALTSDGPDDLSTITKEISELDKEYLSPLGEINFTVSTDSKDYDIVSIQIPKNETVEKLLKSNENGEYKLFSSEMIAFNGEPDELDNWLSTLNYGIYNYQNDLPSKMFVFSPLSGSNLIDLFDNQEQYWDFVSTADGSGYLIDTDNDGNIDLINFLILDEGWFDTRKGERSIIGDPLLPLVTDTTKTNAVSNANLQDGAITSREGDVGLKSSLGANIIKPQSPSDLPINSNLISESNFNLNQGNHYGIGKSIPVEQSSEESDISFNESIESAESPNLVLQQESDDMPKHKANNDIFLSLPKYLPLSNSFEALITSIFLIPIGIDRSIVSVLAKIKGIPKLITNKPIRTYNRTWVIPNTAVNDRQTILMCNGSTLAFSSIELLYSSQYEIMPGFTRDGVSFMWNSLSPHSIGESIKLIRDAYYELMKPSRIPKDWGLWIQQFKSLAKTVNDSDEVNYVKRLESVLSFIDSNNINCIDAFMVAQLNDCKTRFGLP